jgi:hypothetical protein
MRNSMRSPHPTRSPHHPLPEERAGVSRGITALSPGERVDAEGGQVRARSALECGSLLPHSKGHGTPCPYATTPYPLLNDEGIKGWCVAE